MLKKGPLNKVEKCYIDNNKDLSIEEICVDLNRGKKIVENYRKIEETNNHEEKKKEKGRVLELMGKKRGALVMTPAASELADATKTKRNSMKHLQSSIHRPFNNDSVE